MIAKFICIVLLTAGISISARAGSIRASCPDLSPTEIATSTACDRDSDCNRIADQYASCPKLKAWLSAVAPADGKTVTAFDLERGLARARNPFLQVSEASVRYEDCLGVQFTRDSCRVYLGLAAPPLGQKVADIDPATAAERGAVQTLLQEGYAARQDPRGAGRGEAIDALAACESARGSPDRVTTCMAAQQAYAACKLTQKNWDERRTTLIAQLDARRPDLGHNCGLAPIRGMPSDSSGMPTTDMWNCSVNSLRKLQMPGCPGFLPSSWQTPLQALAAWDDEDRANARGTKGRDTRDTTRDNESAVFTSSLFQQATVQAGQLVNDPRTAATKLAADAKARQDEVNQLMARSNERQAAIMGSLVGTVTQALHGAATGNITVPTTTAGALGNTLTTLQQFAAANAGADGSQSAIGGASLEGGTGRTDVGTMPRPSVGGQAITGSCKDSNDELDRWSASIMARKPPNAGPVQLIQTSLYMIQRQISVLSGNACAGDPATPAALAGFRKQYNSALATCNQISSSPCSPKLSW